MAVKVMDAQHVIAAHRREDMVGDGLPQVAFAGRSNVGKSSLLNRLLGRNGLARTSKTPGRTRAVHFYLVVRSSVIRRLYFVDLPGYGFARAGRKEREQWAQLMEEYLRSRRTRRSVTLLIDAAVGVTPLDRQAMEYLRHLGDEPLVVATKADKVPRGRRKAMLERIARDLTIPAGTMPLATSGRTAEGVRDLWRAIDARLGAGPAAAGAEAVKDEAATDEAAAMDAAAREGEAT